jgi:hypothetical protein
MRPSRPPGSRYQEIADYRARNRNKYLAAKAVSNAIAAGRLTRPGHCEMCGDDCDPVAHHDSYSRADRLRVAFLCRLCHAWIHRGRGAEGRRPAGGGDALSLPSCSSCNSPASPQ